MNTHKRLQEMVDNIAKDINDGVQCEDSTEYDGQYEIGDIISGYDYMLDVLDMQYLISSNLEYIGAKILVAFGGPNIWIDTYNKKVDGYWGGTHCTAGYYYDEMDIDATCEDLYFMKKER